METVLSAWRMDKWYPDQREMGCQPGKIIMTGTLVSPFPHFYNYINIVSCFALT